MLDEIDAILKAKTKHSKELSEILNAKTMKSSEFRLLQLKEI